MIKYIIFILPVAQFILNIWLKLFKAEACLEKDFDITKNKGIKGLFFSRFKYAIFPAICLLMTPIYSVYGWIWFGLGVIYLVSVPIMLVTQKTIVKVPGVGSDEFEQAVLKRKKQGIVAILILILWILTWYPIFI